MYYEDFLPLQVYNDSQDSFNIKSPEVGLLKAILFDAIEILKGNFHIHLKKSMRNPKLLKKNSEILLKETRDWILDDSDNTYCKYMFSFVEICEYLHYKPSYVRSLLRNKNLL